MVLHLTHFCIEQPTSAFSLSISSSCTEFCSIKSEHHTRPGSVVSGKPGQDWHLLATTARSSTAQCAERCSWTSRKGHSSKSTTSGHTGYTQPHLIVILQVLLGQVKERAAALLRRCGIEQIVRTPSGSSSTAPAAVAQCCRPTTTGAEVCAESIHVGPQNAHVNLQPRVRLLQAAPALKRPSQRATGGQRPGTAWCEGAPLRLPGT